MARVTDIIEAKKYRCLFLFVVESQVPLIAMRNKPLPNVIEKYKTDKKMEIMCLYRFFLIELYRHQEK